MTMTDRSVKIAAAASVLLGGIVVALLFRHESGRAGLPARGAGDRLVLRKHMEPRGSDPAVPEGHGGRPELPDSTSAVPRPGGRQATILTPMDPGEPPPSLAREYPAGGVPGTSRWGTSIGLSFPDAAEPEESVRTHKIMDGDTLSALAERYLGSADRYLEVYEANRDLLPSPQILPIGVELKIPPRHIRTTPSSEILPGHPLVPIHRGAHGDQ